MLLTRRRWLLFTAVALPAQERGKLAPPVVVLLIGPPGSGKSVQAKYLSRRYKVPAIAVADLLTRSLRQRKVPKQTRIALASGDLASDGLADDLVRARLLQPDAGRGFILDGYPRSAAQAETLDAFLKDHGLPAAQVVVLEASDEIVRTRLIQRGRIDDEPVIIEQRLREFHADFALLQQVYGTARLLRVDAAQPLAAVQRAVTLRLDEAFTPKGFTTDRP